MFPWEILKDDSCGFDLGCGTGRWAFFASEKVKELHCIDPSAEALNVAKKNLINKKNCILHNYGVDDMPLKDESMDFGYSLGVLHHVPNTELGLVNCVKKLKTGAPFLVYLYYSFDNRSIWLNQFGKLVTF